MGKKPYGYLVSCPRIPSGRFFRTLTAAKKEMDRQMRTGSRESGISEVWTKKLAARLAHKHVFTAKFGGRVFIPHKTVETKRACNRSKAALESRGYSVQIVAHEHGYDIWKRKKRRR